MRGPARPSHPPSVLRRTALLGAAGLGLAGWLAACGGGGGDSGTPGPGDPPFGVCC